MPSFNPHAREGRDLDTTPKQEDSTMKTKYTPYLIEWKHEQQDEHGGWAQKHDDGWRWHYIQHGTEYVAPGATRTRREWYEN